MKKMLVICCALLMVMSMSTVAFAATGGFVSSPTGNMAPTVEDFKAADADCTAELKVTPYSERFDLPAVLQELTQKAYDEIRGSKDLTTLNDALAEQAEEMKIAGANLAVSDLFVLHTEGCVDHESHKEFDVTLASDKLKNFVALMYMNENGEWVLVEDAKVVNSEHLVFTADVFAPFAVVVEQEAMQTGETSRTWLYLAIMAASATAMLIVWRASKKQTT